MEARCSGAKGKGGAVANRSVDLRVLVLAGGPDEDQADASTVIATLENLGAPYDFIDVSTGVGVSHRLLRNADGSGRYNGIVLASTDLGDHLTRQDWSRLHYYERTFGVRESVLTGHPTCTPAVDHGMDPDSVTELSRTVGRWTGAAQVFPGLRAVDDIEISNSGFAATPRPDPSIRVTPVMVRADEPSQALLSILHYPDGREVLLSTVRQCLWHVHTQLLAYPFVHFATRGLHLGAPRVRLTVHVDDILVPSATWDPATASPDDTNAYRITPDDLDAAAATQDRLAAEHPTLPEFRFDLAFNGCGAAPDDPLTEALIGWGGAFRHLNHTYTHENLDRSTGIDHPVIAEELLANLRAWEELGLPGADEAARTVVTGSHSGLSDGDVPYHEGCNPALVSALLEVGVRCVAGDATQPGQEVPTAIPGTDVIVVPREPALYYDTSTPAHYVDAYGHRDGWERGVRGRTGRPGRLSYEQVVDLEGQRVALMLMGFDARPHFGHQGNLRVHDGHQASLLSDWLDAVLDHYERYCNWPIENPAFAELGASAAGRLAAKAAGVVASVDVRTGAVSVSASTPTTAELTGLDGGEPYGQVRITRGACGPEPRVFGSAASWTSS